MPPEGEERGAPTLIDVAEAAGVTAKTASMALQHGRGASATVQRVTQVARELGYTVRRQTTREAVLLVTPLELNPLHFAEIESAVRKTLGSADIRLRHENSAGDA